MVSLVLAVGGWVWWWVWGVLGREVEGGGGAVECPRMVILVVGCWGWGCGRSLRVVVEEAAEGAVTLEVTEVTDWRSTVMRG